MRTVHTFAVRASLILALVLLAYPLMMYGQTAATRPAFKSEDANVALKRYQAAEAKAKAEYEKAVAAIRADLIKDLEAAMVKATKAGDLDEALKIRDKIKELQVVAVTTAPAGSLAGKWKVTTEAGWTGQMLLRANGTAVWTHRSGDAPGTWKAADGKLVIVWPKCTDTYPYTSQADKSLKGSSTIGAINTATKE